MHVDLIKDLRREVLEHNGVIDRHETDEKVADLCKEQWIIDGFKDDLRWQAADALETK